MNKTFGMVVGRFQCHKLTDGHIRLIKYANELNDGVVVIIGDRASPPTERNPLSFEIREEMILDEFPWANIGRVWDHPKDEIWSRNLDNEVFAIIGNSPALFYVGRDNFSPHYSGKYNIKEVNFNIECSATDLRNEFKHKTINSPTFRAGVIHARLNSWHRTYMTVDMALLKVYNGIEQICLVRKEGEDVWQLPGGFVDKGETFAEAAAREMMEECHIGSYMGWAFVEDFQIDDWRVRGISGVDHKTILMKGLADPNSEPIADDDIVEAKFFDVRYVQSKILTLIKESHVYLVNRIVNPLTTF